MKYIYTEMAFVSLCLTACLLIVNTNAATDDYFTAAVFEHARLDNATSNTPDGIINTNLEYYKTAAAVAKSKGADIIVYPEYGIFSPNERSELKKYLEYIPDSKLFHTNPCNEKDLYLNRSILYSLSCIAKFNDITVVANMGDIQPCSEQSDCPEDGDFHFNTNVAFDRDGTLVGRYDKEHLFFEFGMDLPKKEQDPVFKTDIGTFGMFVCFDIVFKKTSDIAHLPDVTAILLPTMWIDPTPLMTSIQLWQSWAIGNNVPFLASNVQIPGYSAVGSGIFSPQEALAYTYNPDGTSKLVLANVPKKPGVAIQKNSSVILITPNGSREWDDDGKDVPKQCSSKVLGPPKDVYKDYRCLEENTSNYTLIKLTKLEDYLEACNNGMCCSLEYAMNDTQNDFYFGIYNGTYNMYNRYFWCEENCLLVRCDSFNGRPCATFPMRTTTSFDRISIKANFTTKFVYPSVMTSGMRLLPTEDWTYELPNEMNEMGGGIDFASERGENVIVAGLNGRCYDRDPPYHR